MDHRLFHVCLYSTCFLFTEKLDFFFEKDLESPLIFVLFLKRKQNKKENPNVIPYLEKTICEKQKSGTRVRLLIGKVR